MTKGNVELDLFDVARSCFRRWYVFLPLLLIVGWFSYSTYISVKPVYYSNTVIGLSPPPTRVDNVANGVAKPRNGLLDIGGASLIANMTAVGLRQPSVMDRVAAEGGLPDYSSRMFPVSGGMPPLPLIMVEVTDADPAAVTRTLELVITQANVTLFALQQQARVPDEEMVAPFVVSPPSAPQKGTPSRTRSTVAIFVAGAGLSILVTVVVDILLTLLTRRKSRAQQRRQAKSEAAAGLDPAHPPNDVAEPNRAAVAEGVMDAR
jgi:hypothetical protein